MVGVLEMNQKISRKEQIANWWKIEGKIECIGALILLIVVIAFWDNVFVEAGALLFASLWCLGKIYFRKDQWTFLLFVAAMLFLQGMSILFEHLKS